MRRKIIVLLGFLVIGMALLGTGIWFLINRIQPGNMEIAVIPSPGSALTTPWGDGELSKVLLENVQIEKTASSIRYDQMVPNYSVQIGDPILSITIDILNIDLEYDLVYISAVGYDASGVQVARTLDDVVHAWVFTKLAYQETGEITLHLNFSNKIKLIKIFGANSKYLIP